MQSRGWGVGSGELRCGLATGVSGLGLVGLWNRIRTLDFRL